MHTSWKIQKRDDRIVSNITPAVVINDHQRVLYSLGKVFLGTKYPPGFSLSWEIFIFTGFVEETGALSKW